MFFKHFISLVQTLITLFTVALSLFLSTQQDEKGDYISVWSGLSEEVKYVVIVLVILNIILLRYNLISNSRSQKKFLEKRVALINNIAKLAYELVTNEKKSTDNKRNGKRAENGCDDENSVNTPHLIRILVLIHYNNSWYRKIILYCHNRKIKREYFKDRFVTIAGYNHKHVITDGIPFDMKSATGMAYFNGITIRQEIQADNQLGSTNRQLCCVLSTPIVYNGCSVGTLNIDSSDPDSSVCSMENSATLERFAKIIANIVGSDLNGYRSYVAKRYRRYILEVHKIERVQHD